MVDKDKLLELLPKLSGRRILVLGDLFLDEYVVGRATRLSREAPIPVLEFSRRFELPGGAANPAHNICALGGQAYAVGVVGRDAEGERLMAMLQEAGIHTEGVVVDPDRPTTTKTRIVAEGTLVFPQQVARIDRQDRQPVAGEVEEALNRHLRKLIPQVDAVLVSDYKSGVVTSPVLGVALSQARHHGKLITADSQGDLYNFKGFDVIKSNRRETERTLGRSLDKEADFRRASELLLDELSAQVVLITRGGEGMSLISQGEGYVHIPAANRSEVFDVTGAGDTVIAVLTLALAAGATILQAAHLANYAAGLVVRKLGNATATQEELAWAIENW
ncbi:MAG: bifunctional heptose 7-phosphate kinase/heptose 1-phosphate adenyltransferase [Anaerolineae bacterium]